MEQAEKLGVPESDRPKLTYRLGKTGFWLGANPAQAASNLAQSVKSADDPAEGYGLLAQAYEKSGDQTRATEYYRKVMTSNAHNPTNAFARPLAKKKLEMAKP